MKSRTPILLGTVVALVLVGILAYFKFHGHEAAPSLPVSLGTNAPVATAEVRPPEHPTTNGAAAADTNVVYQISAGSVLATVNGVQIKLGDLVPLTTTNADMVVPLDAVTYKYLLDRAIVRELMMQAARAQGVGLSDAQQQQLAKLEAQRSQPEPGLLSKLNASSADVELELRDAEAFMLQTAVMAKNGYSPDVTPADVEGYYHDHKSQFGDPPTDPEERKQWMQNLDVTIRNLLQKQKQLDYRSARDTFVDGQKAAANITVNTPPH